jgi:7,8-dihydropterin-6-yl-methyl-4-(beta-D-ribofuranosyl)aminobenzene 5'-phosphate synthase
MNISEIEVFMIDLDSLTVTVVAEDSVGYETPYLGQHGISLFISAVRGERETNILFDVAQNPEALLSNMRLLDLEPESVDVLVLSHCHYDHTQGLATIVKAIGRDGLPVIGHRDLFRPHFITDPELRHVGVPVADGPEALGEAGGSFFPVVGPFEIVPVVMRMTERTQVAIRPKIGVPNRLIVAVFPPRILSRERPKKTLAATACSPLWDERMAAQAMMTMKRPPKGPMKLEATAA